MGYVVKLPKAAVFGAANGVIFMTFLERFGLQLVLLVQINWELLGCLFFQVL